MINEKWRGYSPPSPPCSAALDQIYFCTSPFIRTSLSVAFRKVYSFAGKYHDAELSRLHAFCLMAFWKWHGVAEVIEKDAIAKGSITT